MNIILIAENKAEEQAKAKKVVIESGAKVVMGGTLKDVKCLLDKLAGKITGILTDIHFPEVDGANENSPCGLAVVIWAVQEKIPVSICSDVNHHYADYLEMIVDGLKKLSNQEIPFTMDTKDWQKALDGLKEVQKTKEA